MDEQVGGPISTVLQLDPAVTMQQVSNALAHWLKTTHDVDLASSEDGHLVIEWRASDDENLTCQLVASDSVEKTRRTITVLRDDIGMVAFVEGAPLAAPDAPHLMVDLSKPTRQLLDVLAPIAKDTLGMMRGETHDLRRVNVADLMVALEKDLAPGLLIAVTSGDHVTATSAQAGLLDALRGLAVVGSAPVGCALLQALGASPTPRSGCVVSITRTASGLDAQVIAATSLRVKPDSARRLAVRRHLSAPVPFDLERRRSSAMRRLFASDQELDLPTALMLLDEESQRANVQLNRANELETQLERAYEEQDSALSDLDDALSRLRFLERAFRELGEVPTIEQEFDDDWRPDSSAGALIAAQDVLPYLILSATEERCSELDSRQKRGIWAKKIWMSLRALNDYGKAKAEGQFRGDITMYRDDPPAGAIPLLAEYAPGESQSTSTDSAMKAVRTFAVPTAVDPSGKVYMGQHLKVDKGGQSAPRIHLYDDTGGPTQRVYVGYIGPHLPTSSGF